MQDIRAPIVRRNDLETLARSTEDLVMALEDERRHHALSPAVGFPES